MKSAARSPRLAAATAYCVASVDLPAPAGPMISVLDAPLEAAAEQRVELGDAAGELPRASHVAAMLGRDQPRVDARCRRVGS